MDGVVEADLEARLRLPGAALALFELLCVRAGRLARAERQRGQVVEPAAGGGWAGGPRIGSAAGG